MIKELIANQFRKPSGFFGRIISRIMVNDNQFVYRSINKKSLFKKDDLVLEIGYGPGSGINYLLNKNRDIKAHGIDFSKLMYKKAKKRNKNFIKNNRLKLNHGDFLEYDIKDFRYNIIMAFNVIYFISDLNKFFLKVFTSLKDDGVFILVMAHEESLKNRSFTNISVFNKYKIERVVKDLNNSGFNNVKFDPFGEKDVKGYYIYGMKN